MGRGRWMIYGAYGYTGELVAAEAVRRGHEPVLAGRDERKLRPVGERLGLPSLPLDLRNADCLAEALSNVEVVYHAAGPFVETSAAMTRACLDAGVSTIDISGEMQVLDAVLSLDDQARERGVALIPACGFDVVATDCLARHVAERVSEPTTLEIATAAALGGHVSPGTGKTMVGMLPDGLLARRDGRLTSIRNDRTVQYRRFLDRKRRVLPVSMGDLVTAFRTTGIPNIATFTAFPERTASSFARVQPALASLMSVRPLRRAGQAFVAQRMHGPDESARLTERAYAWARASNNTGDEVQVWLETAEAYQFTALAGVLCVERLLAKRPTGALTPALAFGADFVLDVPGSRRIDVEEELPPVMDGSPS